MRFSDCSSDVCSSDLSSLSLDFTRVQFTPDLMPSDLLGQLVYTSDAAPGGAGSFRFREGPVFTNLLLADEINRTPPKTQAALLEAMEERQVTVERSEEHTSELQSLMRISYAVFCLKKK